MTSPETIQRTQKHFQGHIIVVNDHPKQKWNGRFVTYFSQHTCKDTSISLISKLFFLGVMACAGAFVTTIFFNPATTLNDQNKNIGLTIFTCAQCLVFASVVTEIFRCVHCMKMRSLVPSAFLMMGVELLGGEIASTPLLNEAWQMQYNYTTNQTLISNELVSMSVTCKSTFQFAGSSVTAPNCWVCPENNWFSYPSTTQAHFLYQLQNVSVNQRRICSSEITTTLNELPSSFKIDVNQSSFPSEWPCWVPQWKLIQNNSEGFNALHEILAENNLHPPAVLEFRETSSTDELKCWSLSGSATSFFNPSKQCDRNSTWLPNPQTYNPCLSDSAIRLLDSLTIEAAELNKTALPYPKKAIDMVTSDWPNRLLGATVAMIFIGIGHEGFAYGLNYRRKKREEQTPLLVYQT